jgi:hypothetical protein
LGASRVLFLPELATQASASDRRRYTVALLYGTRKKTASASALSPSNKDRKSCQTTGYKALGHLTLPGLGHLLHLPAFFACCIPARPPFYEATRNGPSALI